MLKWTIIKRRRAAASFSPPHAAPGKVNVKQKEKPPAKAEAEAQATTCPGHALRYHPGCLSRDGGHSHGPWWPRENCHDSDCDKRTQGWKLAEINAGKRRQLEHGGSGSGIEQGAGYLKIVIELANWATAPTLSVLSLAPIFYQELRNGNSTGDLQINGGASRAPSRYSETCRIIGLRSFILALDSTLYYSTTTLDSSSLRHLVDVGGAVFQAVGADSASPPIHSFAFGLVI